MSERDQHFVTMEEYDQLRFALQESQQQALKRCACEFDQEGELVESCKFHGRQQTALQELAEALRKCADGCEHDGYDMSYERAALAKATPWLRKEED